MGAWNGPTKLGRFKAPVPRVCIGPNFFFWIDGAGELMAKQRQRVEAIKHLGVRIQQLCQRAGLSQREVERRAGLNGHLHRIVGGQIRKPYSSTIVRIARVLGVGPLTADRARIEPELEGARRVAQLRKR
jgi:hypothetical protein